MSVNKTAQDRPNVILIVVDDLGAVDLACTGSDFYETPHLDALAASGMRFTDAYASAPVCSPTRASLLTGKSPARVGVTQYIGGFATGALRDVPYFRELPEDEYTLARALADAGYASWHVGKWHLGPRRTWPDRHGFEVNIGGCHMGSPTTYHSPYGIETLEEGPEGEYLTDRLTNEAITLIRERDARPFFLNLWHYAVHTPIEPPGGLSAKYEAKARRMGRDLDVLRDEEEMPTWHLRGVHVRRRQRQGDPDYAAMVEHLDACVGRLLDALDDEGIRENTLIIFTSDNGGLATAEGSPTSNLPLAEGKGWMQEGGVRIPLLVSMPGVVPHASISEVPAISADIYPTVLGMCGLPLLPEQHVDGVDLSSHWRGRPAERGPLFWHYPHYANQGGTPGAAVRDGRYKLIRLYEDDTELLFDLEADVSEQHDLCAVLPGEADRLRRLLDTWIEDVGGLIPRRRIPLRDAEGRAIWPPATSATPSEERPSAREKDADEHVS
ncbi:sulfatase [Microbacterium xanthum]|uniref:sulfatase n=1 Tax=Microbacterium xanthum TaxID=3079794 RepID=UPI002AD43211|nr:sulfatase [Microbacterium sp. KSW-48]MDZ8171180.1 sulfatase [Microbacterium sp. KSW-48]